MAMSGVEIERLIREAFPDAHIVVTALADDGDHYAARDEFEGVRRAEPCAAASDGVCGSQRTDGRRSACAGTGNVGTQNGGINDV